MQMFTKSTVFFDNAKGWKSQQGGLSSIQQVTTDANNMGGLFIRKVGGAASLAVQSQKLIPLLFHPNGAMWNRGHFRPLLITAALSNIMLAIFYGMYMQDFTFAQAEMLPMVFIGVLCFETAVIIYYLCTQKRATRIHSVAMPAGKTPTSVVSRILTRTVLTVSGFQALIAARDLFLPGYILKFIPRDDIYLEWTGAFLHSPPLDSQEAQDQGMTASLFIGEMYLSQFMALNILILCLYKFVTALFIRYGRDASGVIQAKMIWKCQVFGNVLNLLLFRLFAPAALSASLDLRWHLMAFAYETVILGTSIACVILFAFHSLSLQPSSFDDVLCRYLWRFLS
jgi:hypothetical protein